MNRGIRILGLVALASAILAPAVCGAQAPPQSKSQGAPTTEQRDPKACAQASGNERATVGQGGGFDMQKPAGRSLSDQLARTDGVICPPLNVDPEIKAPTPPDGPMPVIPPPGSPGGNQDIQPK